MPRTEVHLSLDVEASGPIPGPHWMCSFGICRTDDLSQGFTRKLKPLDLPGAQPDMPAAMEVVSMGIPDMLWSKLGDTPEARCQAVRAHFQQEGVSAVQALLELRDWIREQTGPRGRAVVIGAPVTFDFMWLYWYWWFLLEEMPPFGFSGLDLRSYFMGAHGVGFLGTGKQRYLKHYPNDIPHSHDPLDDARQQGQIWHDMVTAREQSRIVRD